MKVPARPSIRVSRPAHEHAAPLLVLDWLAGYQRTWLPADVIAGLTLWALVVPQAIAYAQIAGLPPEAGLFATFGGLLGYALLGTSRQLVVSPTSSTAAVSAAIVAPMAAGDPERFLALSAGLALTCGVVLAGLGLLKLGFVSRFIAASVQAGFMIGLGLTIIVGQCFDLLGIPGVDGDFFPKLQGLLENLDSIDGWTAALGLGSLGVLFGLRRFAPGLPAGLIVVVMSIALVGIFGLEAKGVAVIGDLDATLHGLQLPALTWADFEMLLPGTLAIAIIGYAESATVGESLGEKHRYDVKPGRELYALGSANLLAGVFQGFIVGGGASQSAANDRAGAHTQLAGLIVAGLTLLTAAVLLPLFRDLPQAVLAAIVISAVTGFLDFRRLSRIGELRRDSLVLALLTLAGVLVFGILLGLLIAIALSILLLLSRMSRPHASWLVRAFESDTAVVWDEAPAGGDIPGVLVYRLNAPMLFINAKRLRDDVKASMTAARTPVRVVVIDLSFSSGLDVESVDVLTALAAEVRGHGAEVWLTGVHRGAREVLTRAGAFEGPAAVKEYGRTEDVTRDLLSRRGYNRSA